MAKGSGSAFVKGVFVCLMGFIVLGLVVLALTGGMDLNPVGVLFVFVVGCLNVWIVLAISKKGYSQGREDKPRSDDESLSGH
jgi:hypothetical protein